MGRPALRDYDRRQLALLDSVRRGGDGEVDWSACEVMPWGVTWATGEDIDERLKLKVHVGRVVAVAFGVFGGRPLVAACTSDEVGSNFELRVWDALSAESWVLPCVVRVSRMSFSATGDQRLLVTGHPDGWLRIWDVERRSLHAAEEIGDDRVVDLYVVESGAQVVTLHVSGVLRRRSLPSGELVEVPDTPGVSSLSGGWLADGRSVLVTGGDAVQLWDGLGGVPARQLPIPARAEKVVSVALTASAGRGFVTLVDQNGVICTLNLDRNGRLGGRISAHRHLMPADLVMEVWSGSGAHATLAAVAGTLAVPTASRVHLWDLATSQRRLPPIGGPVARSIVQAVRWDDRELLLTASRDDGVVALWDLDESTDIPLGHTETITQIALVESGKVVVSVDRAGRVVARDSRDGDLLAQPFDTGIQNPLALAAWTDGGNVIAATGAGEPENWDGRLWRWNVTRGRPADAAIRAHRGFLHHMARLRLHDEDVLVTFGGTLKVFRCADGGLVAETMTGVQSRVTGFATGVINDRPYAALSSYGQPMTLHALDDLAEQPIIIPEAGNDTVLAIVGSHVVAAHYDAVPAKPDTVHLWSAAGNLSGPAVRGAANVVLAAGRRWPAVYIGRDDGTVSLTDVETGRDLCPPILLPGRPAALTVTDNGDLIAAFGRDLVRVVPPID